MATQKNLKLIEKLPRNTLNCLDAQDFMAIVNKLMIQKEDIQNEIRTKVVEIDTWIQMLEASSADELRELFDSLPNISEFTQEETKLVQEYCEISEQLNAHRLISNCHAMLNEEGDIILKFSPDTMKNFRFLVWITTTEDSEYRVQGHDMPPSIPIAKFEEKYMKNKVGTDEILKKFATALYQYTWPLFQRLHQINTIEESNVLGKIVQPYRNSGLTLISFLLDIGDELDNKFTFEFVLKYHPQELLPYEVKAVVLRDKIPAQSTRDSIDGLVYELKSRPVVNVLLDFFGRIGEQSIHTMNSDGSSSSASTTLFEML